MVGLSQIRGPGADACLAKAGSCLGGVESCLAAAPASALAAGDVSGRKAGIPLRTRLGLC